MTSPCNGWVMETSARLPETETSHQSAVFQSFDDLGRMLGQHAVQTERLAQREHVHRGALGFRELSQPGLDDRHQPAGCGQDAGKNPGAVPLDQHARLDGTQDQLAQIQRVAPAALEKRLAGADVEGSGQGEMQQGINLDRGEPLDVPSHPAARTPPALDDVGRRRSPAQGCDQEREPGVDEGAHERQRNGVEQVDVIDEQHQTSVRRRPAYEVLNLREELGRRKALQPGRDESTQRRQRNGGGAGAREGRRRRMPAGLRDSHEFLRQPRFSDPGVAGENDRPNLGVVEQRLETFEVDPATDEGPAHPLGDRHNAPDQPAAGSDGAAADGLTLSGAPRAHQIWST